VRPRDLMVIILDRPRDEEMVKRIRAVGTRIRFIPHGDVSGALMAASPDTGIDLLWGIGGTPEGVLSAAAFKCLGGQFQGKLWPRNPEERQAALDAGYDVDKVLSLDDLVLGDNTFFAATGVTDGDLLRGVRYTRGGARTHSLVMRSRSGTVRTLQATHSMDKLAELAGDRYAWRAAVTAPVRRTRSTSGTSTIVPRPPPFRQIRSNRSAVASRCTGSGRCEPSGLIPPTL